MASNTYHIDIHWGDIAYCTDEKGKFIRADYIKCGEWSIYTAEEVTDFISLLDYYGLTEHANRLRATL